MKNAKLIDTHTPKTKSLKGAIFVVSWDGYDWYCEDLLYNYFDDTLTDEQKIQSYLNDNRDSGRKPLKFFKLSER